MSKKLQQAMERVENELILHGAGSMSSQFAQFIKDLWTLIEHVKQCKRRKRE
jgi:hypothetical protein